MYYLLGECWRSCLTETSTHTNQKYLVDCLPLDTRKTPSYPDNFSLTHQNHQQNDYFSKPYHPAKYHKPFLPSPATLPPQQAAPCSRFPAQTILPKSSQYRSTHRKPHTPSNSLSSFLAHYSQQYEAYH